ncbi:hypothetical protein FEDK69T_18740 [Flavobacterium enshiense DK69]|uniref:Uncharacterized protein n=1 Tax=Flavobacterium enshiense DK69 TaxID=1107311 RepID=V6S7D7_9FLAO|nr:hypothetical protein [Flavobacterium enshiense]ESU22618.1 hypothetical protein FEDK69T_18740 [Flavobacterium enshiense DK69]KGO95668.1 hypothetical protein Q767_10650 [Flavobacterium enshiense DK69]
MKKKITIILFLFNFFTVFSQEQQILKEYSKQVITIDSLKKVIKTEKEKNRIQNDTLIKKDGQIKNLKSNLSKLDKFKEQKKNFEIQIKQKGDSISILKKEISKTNQQLLDERKICEQKSLDEKGKIKSEILTTISNTYKNKKFDELILSSNKLSVQRDLRLIGENNELKSILSDLNSYFEGKELLDKAFDSKQITNIQLELNKIKQQSELLGKLKEKLKNYESLCEGLKVCLNDIVSIDKKETVSGMDKEFKQLKLNKILTEISQYIFDYDFDFAEYPYLSNVLSQVIKVKVPNPDRDISNLLKS